MLQHIKQLELAGDHAELLRLAETLPQGDALARAYIALSKLAEDRATTGAEYRHALAYAQRAVTAAEPLGLMWTWSQGRTAALAADLGSYGLAERAAGAFLDALPDQPTALALAPWVRFHLGVVRSKQRLYAEAADLFRLTLAANAGEISERAQLHLAWTLAESGRPLEAFAALPAAVVHVSQGQLNAASAVVFAATGDWQSARVHALAALRTRDAGEWRTYDTVQAAELKQILRLAADHAGDFQSAAAWRQQTAAILSGWNSGLLSGLLPTLPAKGGELHSEAASSCGPTGYRRTGLRGVVG